ncbi:MAG: protein arginine kinase [Planctomycetota bacterium]|nr:protein arginine kinase [Planctomycetota bacterium]
MKLSDLQSSSGEWLGGTGPEADIVISSRIRLARNLRGQPFLSSADEQQFGQLERLIRESMENAAMPGAMSYFGMQTMPMLDRQFLVERHLISREHAYGKGPRGVGLAVDETVSVMVNEEDHLRIQGLCSGLQLREAWSRVDAVDTGLENGLKYAFSTEFGYLTVCPTNAGTGLRASVMLHLPALVMTRQIDKVFQAVSKIGLIVRGLYGEGTQASGDFYQISNQSTLGKSEMAIIENIEVVIPKIIEYEKTVRNNLMHQKHEVMEDKVWRAYAMLKYARVITSEETMDLLSAVRMGVSLGIIQDIKMSTINELFLFTQPAHLQKQKEAQLDEFERDMVRASYIRKKLQQGE